MFHAFPLNRFVAVRTGRRLQRYRYRPQLESLEDRNVLNAGMLDPTFGAGGVVVDQVLPYLAPVNAILAVQNDGKLVVAGEVWASNFKVARDNSDGSPDLAFGAGGAIFVSAHGRRLTLEPDGGTVSGPSETVTVAAIAVQTDGKIVVAGSFVYGSYSDGPSFRSGASDQFQPMHVVFHYRNSFFVARFNSDGSVDNSFGQGGMALTSIGNDATVSGMDIQTNGKIVVAGTSDGRYALARYNENGTLDDTFGDHGAAVTTIAGTNDAAVWGLAIQDDGKLVLAGTFPTGPTRSDIALARFNPDGNLDPSFGDHGVVETLFGDYGSTPTDVLLQKDGDIVTAVFALVGGTPTFPGKEVAVMRYTPDGGLDPSFGDQGQLLTGIHPFDAFIRVGLQEDGKILLAASDNATVTNLEVVLARFGSDGVVDPTFANNGQLVTTLGQFSASDKDMKLLPDGQIIIAGLSSASDPRVTPYMTCGLTLARFTNDSVPLLDHPAQPSDASDSPQNSSANLDSSSFSQESITANPNQSGIAIAPENETFLAGDTQALAPVAPVKIAVNNALASFPSMFLLPPPTVSTSAFLNPNAATGDSSASIALNPEFWHLDVGNQRSVGVLSTNKLNPNDSVAPWMAVFAADWSDPFGLSLELLSDM